MESWTVKLRAYALRQLESLKRACLRQLTSLKRAASILRGGLRIPRDKQMNHATTFRARFRFRVQKKLNIKEHEYRFEVGEREVVLSPSLPNIPISESEWLVMNARDFDSENAAAAFAQKLKAASEISSVATRLGIDSGINLATAGLGQAVKAHILEQFGREIRDNIHGIDVFPDDPNVGFLNVMIAGTVLTQPDPFLSHLNRVFDVADNASKSTKETVLLLNYAP